MNVSLRSLTIPDHANVQAIPIIGLMNLHAEYYHWDALIHGKASVTIPPFSVRRAIIDLGDCCRAYAEMVTTGGSGGSVRVSWAESLFNEPEARTEGNRNATERKYFVGAGDTLKPDGGRCRKFETLWWEAGRFVEILAQTAGESLTIESFRVHEARHPLATDR